MVKKGFFLIFLAVLLLGLVIGGGSLEIFSGNFTEGFELGNFSTNEWTSVGGATLNWVISNSDAYSGVYAAYASNTDAESILSTGINTSGYGAINFSFWYMTSALDSGEYLRVDWYNGINWVNVLDLTGTNVDYTFANFFLPSSASDNENFAIRFRCDVSHTNEFCAVDNISVSGVELLGIDLADIYLLNQDGDRIQELNNTAAETSDKMIINFSVNHLNDIDSWYLNYSANGTNGCAFGNKQSSVCYSYPNWIKFIDDTETDTFDATKESQSDYIRAYLSEGNESNFSFLIDEHYNPNVFKWYEADFNFSDEKWQNETKYRVTGDNMLKFEFNSSIVPLDIDLARIDLRVAYKGAPEKLEMFICNSSYVNQDPHIYLGCQLIEEKNYYELEENGTKFKAFFSKNLVEGIGDLKYAILHSAEINPEEYYYIRTYGATNENYSIHWEYSNDYGANWNVTNESYATQININWFYGGNNPTAFVYRFWANTTSGEEKYLEGNLTWEIDPVNNYEPIAVFVSPPPSEYLELPYNVTFSIADTNNDELNVTLDLYKNSTFNTTLFSEINGEISNYYWNDSIDEGFYFLFLNVCETNTTDLFCRNATREIVIDNEAPSVSLISPIENSIYYDNVTNEIEFAANVSDLGVDSIYLNLTYPNGTISQINLSYAEGNKYNGSFEIPMLAGRYNVTAVAIDYLGRMNDSETTYFVLNDVSSPEVVLEYPYGNNIYNNDSVEISASILDSENIDSIIATIFYPNSSVVNVTNFFQSLVGDNFNFDTMDDVWEFRNDSVAEGQVCYSDIDNTIEGSLFLSVSGEGLSGNSLCGVSSLDKLVGDYDISIDFNIISMGSDSFFVFRAGSIEELYSSGRRLFISLRQVDSQRYYRFGYLDGTELKIIQVATEDLYGKLRIKRYNSSEGNYLYDAYYWDNENNLWVRVLDGVSVTGSSMGQYAQIYLESAGDGWGKINVSVNNFNAQSEEHYFALFNPPVLEGRYNVTFFVNDSLGNVNDTEESWFNLSIINTAPSNPIIYHPFYGEYFSGEEYISWSEILDTEGNSLRFNISLLNLDDSLNGTIVSEYGNSDSLNYLWNTSEFVDEEYKIQVVVYENETDEGYSANSSAFLESFFIDNTEPEIGFLGGTSLGTIYDSNTIFYNSSGEDLNFKNLTVILYSSNGTVLESSSTNLSNLSGNFTGLDFGQYFLGGIVYDLAGNFRWVDNRTIILSRSVTPTSFSSSQPDSVGSFSKNFLLSKGNSFAFEVNSIPHEINCVSFSDDFAILRVYSDVFENALFEGDIWKIDFEDDGFYDIEIQLESIFVDNVAVSINEINESVFEVKPSLKENDSFSENFSDGFGGTLTGDIIEGDLTDKFSLFVFGVAIFIVGLYFVFRFFKVEIKKFFIKLKYRIFFNCPSFSFLWLRKKIMNY